jgi:hypothetical protein
VLTSATSTYSDSSACDPSTKRFEQIMTVSGDRFYLERKAAQLNMILTGTVSPDGALSGAGVVPSAGQTNAGISIMLMLTGKIEENQFAGSIISRNCSYSIQMKK